MDIFSQEMYLNYEDFESILSDLRKILKIFYPKYEFSFSA